jgi:hypothetical protein
MRITLEFRRPTPSHCTVAVFINGALAGELTLRQEEIGAFHQIVAHGCSADMDSFLSTGDPKPRLLVEVEK